MSLFNGLGKTGKEIVSETEDRFLLLVTHHSPIKTVKELYGKKCKPLLKYDRKKDRGYDTWDILNQSFGNFGAACMSKKALMERFFQKTDYLPTIEVVPINEIVDMAVY